VIPKTIEANLAWREKLRNAAAHDPGFAAQLKAACGKSIYFWINGFVWTYRVKRVDETGKEVPVSGHKSHVPFITWSVQDEFIPQFQDCIEGGHDALIDKARDMGASWLILTVIHHYWQFVANFNALEVSRKEDLVDSRGDMDSLFEKHRYILKWQPSFLRPRVRDNYMHLENLDLQSTIDGESTNQDVARGGRKQVILLDEFAAVPNGSEIVNATADSTSCRIYNSTPKGPGTEFTKIKNEKRARILELHWSRHPEKSRGAHQVLDEQGKPKWTSPWYERECARRSKKDIAQNLDMDHGQAGESFFDHSELNRHPQAHRKDPLFAADLVLLGDLGDEGKCAAIRKRDARAMGLVRGGNRAPWRFYLPLVEGRPPQQYSYVFGVDISNGAGGSNSVITVVAHEIGQVVAKCWSAFHSPEEWAEVAAFGGVWFGGNGGPAFICYEANGPGGIFGRKLYKKLAYPHVYFQRPEGVKDDERTNRYGWHSNNAKKEILLGSYRESLKTDALVNPCAESIKEALDYVYDDAGKLIPGRLAEESEGGRALHGDHVIADALADMARRELPKFRELFNRPPAGSFAARRETWKDKKEAQDPWRD
jgi:hypothetical protein